MWVHCRGSARWKPKALVSMEDCGNQLVQESDAAAVAAAADGQEEACESKISESEVGAESEVGGDSEVTMALGSDAEDEWDQRAETSSRTGSAATHARRERKNALKRKDPQVKSQESEKRRERYWLGIAPPKKRFCEARL